uniref:Uncharacterized protein n=1 Tax=Vespula pensylvanica TaxID=30213 RepID=A0A834NJ32_VESPE|nr:hypothetical protein H0235_013477 [Vespula pensylvanica]
MDFIDRQFCPSCPPYHSISFKSLFDLLAPSQDDDDDYDYDDDSDDGDDDNDDDDNDNDDDDGDESVNVKVFYQMETPEVLR